MKILQQRLATAFNLTEDLAKTLNQENLKLPLGTLPSNTIGEQFGCIIGARESYARAIEQGAWAGYTCSVSDCHSQDQMLRGLQTSGLHIFARLEESLQEEQLQYAFLLLEHEVQHHGQLIRYMYGNRLPFPPSWHTRYTV
jgi:hypothetical protein